MKKLKVLKSDLTSPFQEFQYEIGKEYICHIIIRETGVPELISLAKPEEKRLGYKLSEVLAPIYPLQGLPMKKLKVLNSDLTSPFQKFQYEIGKEYICHNFDNNPNKECSRGFYATDIEGLPYSFNIKKKVFEVHVSGGAVIIDQYKQRFESQTITREVAVPELISLAKPEEKRLGYKLSEVLAPIYPLQGLPKEVTSKEIELLNQWASVWDSVSDTVWDSVSDTVWDSVSDTVGDSVRASVGDSVSDTVWASVSDTVGASVWDSGDSVRATVRATVRASVWAYISSLFINIDYKEGTNPLQPGIDLWKRGFVPSYDGKVWRLHSGEKATIVHEKTKSMFKKRCKLSLWD